VAPVRPTSRLHVGRGRQRRSGNEKSRPKAAFCSSAPRRATGSARSGFGRRGGGASSSGGGADGSGGSARRGVGGGSRSRGRRRGSGRGGSRRRLFLLAASGQGSGGDQGGQNERFLHFSFLLRDWGQRFRNFVLAGEAASDRAERLERFPTQPNIIATKGFYIRCNPHVRNPVQSPSVVAGKAGVALSSHSLRVSRNRTRRSASPPQ
jgi:hypothetical protein